MEELDYIKSLYVLYEELDPEDEESFYTYDFTLSDKFSDDQIKEAIDGFEDDDDKIYSVVLDLISNEAIGEIKSLYIRDKNNKVLSDREFT